MLTSFVYETRLELPNIAKMKKNCFLLTPLLLALCEAFSVENISKCSIKDNECQRKLYQNVITEVGKSGIPDLGIPSLDPATLKNVNVAVLNMVNLTLVEGEAKGIKDCVLNKFEVDIEKGIEQQEIMCDLTIEGNYKLFGNGDLLKQILGKSELRGEGKGKVTLEKLVLRMKHPIRVEKHDDGEVYLNLFSKDFEYDYDIKGKATFAADNIYVGKENISDFVVKYLNVNWKYVLRTFGRAFVDKAMEFYYDFCQKFFSGIPMKNLIVDDLTPYIKE